MASLLERPADGAVVTTLTAVVMATALDPYPDASSSPHPTASAAREEVEATVSAAEGRLQRAVEDGAGDDELQQLAVSLHGRGSRWRRSCSPRKGSCPRP